MTGKAVTTSLLSSLFTSSVPVQTLEALLVGDGIEAGAAELGQEVLGAHRRQQVAVADAGDLDVDLRRC